MDFTFTEDQKLFADNIRSVFLKEVSPELLRELWDSETGRSAALWNLLAEQGLTAFSIAEAAGGLGLTDVDWVPIAQEVGYFALPEPLLDTAWLGVGILAALPDGAAALRDEWLGRIAEGSARIAIGGPLNPLVADAHVADLLLLHHNGEVHAVPRAAVKLTANPGIEQSRRLFRVEWTPSAQTRIADAAQGQLIWQQTVNRGVLAVAAQLIGLAGRMLDISVDYSVDRKQFGKPIGSFQALKHYMADVAVKIEFARPVLHRAAYALAQEQQRAAVHASHAFLAALDAALHAAKKGIQVHGAMGYTWEVDLQIFMKRAWVLAAAWGDKAFHKSRIADFVLSEKAPLGPGHTFIE
ncbi:Butyryl-CoA dehydrogenase [Sterolibacterium denitrificans]|uniref:Acyl-CoA dehydrogenase n=2 Tax=Sterolibacterium denitrificans TaxID=157592 RepID=A0A656Z7R9_9PROT|nr:acyl-CoA dehydrogenase family protein [Sterolibacterium denitrificans]KYC29090.1 acyl-CoA dehydrogenase [Sterolibacterium denitrificans]SMB21429.1 Butyryl-CoA dehydrogenase [Sterolibacterium denitrificans]